jgi:hypothetical protein
VRYLELVFKWRILNYEKYFKVFSHQSTLSNEKDIIVIAIFNQIIQYVKEVYACCKNNLSKR